MNRNTKATQIDWLAIEQQKSIKRKKEKEEEEDNIEWNT